MLTALVDVDKALSIRFIKKYFNFKIQSVPSAHVDKCFAFSITLKNFQFLMKSWLAVSCERVRFAHSHVGCSPSI